MSNLDELVADAPMDLVALGRLKNASRNTLLRLAKAGRITYSVDDGVVKIKPSDFDTYVVASGAPR